MASATSLMTDESFLCSICLEVFIKPVSIPCGHTFCLKCITDYWATVGTLYQCPLCKEEFYPKPMLRVNIFIAEMAEKFAKIVEKKSSNSTAQAESGKVLCDQCTEPKLTALKSCLVCFTSYCQTHLEPHQNISALKKHKLIHPVKNLESRICKTHDEPLELFCRVDQMFLCKCCKNNDHKTHKVVSIEEEAQMRKIKLGIEKEGTDQMIQGRQQKILEIQHSLEAGRNNAEEALSCSRHVMTTMVDYIKSSQTELTEVIKTKQKKLEKEGKAFISELDGDIMQIRLKNLQLNEVLVTDDHFSFLENILSLTIFAPQVKDWSDVMITSNQFPIQEAMAKLEASITKEISTLCDPTFREKQRHAVDVTFDPDTANHFLNVSEDGKQVTHGNHKTFVTNKPQRFDHVLNVLAKEGFSSGKFYFEVQVKDKTQWDLGVASECINRKGDIRLSPKSGYWTIWLRKGKDFTANAGPAIHLHVREMPEKIGVFADYEDGEVSFYNVDARTCIYSFTGCTFTKKLFPFFSPCINDGGKNAAPLIITPVTYNS
ncbi:E3 ubiquitin-protein ligase TRIM21-like [Odontesthes bonariensis]|uniref:E3 ubiquitin-protein ligase TRIM21-like n=1 Tax=Odontesthes bonariensis TaxID=219752 RepID=UPI003F580E07